MLTPVPAAITIGQDPVQPIKVAVVQAEPSWYVILQWHKREKLIISV
jgi:hypothetical protein